MSASLAFLKHGISLSISLPFFQNKKGQENSMKKKRVEFPTAV
jgi:hypothetical protein